MMKKFSIIKVFFLIGVILLSSCDNVAYQEDIVQDSPAGSNEKDFLVVVSQTEVAVGQTITFDDQSIAVVSREWTIPGGEPKSSSAAVVTPFWETSGEKEVILKITFSDGSVKEEKYMIKVVSSVIYATATAFEAKINQKISFKDLSFGVVSRSWNFSTSTVTDSAGSTESEVYASWDSLGEKTGTLTVKFVDGSELTKTFTVNIVDKPNLWSPLIQGFEDPNSHNSWQTWNGELAANWPVGTLTSVVGGANGTDRAGQIIYNGEGSTAPYWGMITRDARSSNARLENGKTYVFSFWIKADQPVKTSYIRVVNLIEGWMLPGNEGDVIQSWYSPGGQTGLDITSEWQYFEKEFTVNFPVNSGYSGDVGLNAYPEINFNQDTPNVFYVDEFKLKEK